MLHWYMGICGDAPRKTPPQREEARLEAFRAWLQQLQFGRLWEYLLVAAAALLCITFHETCHGLAALWLGDDTARRQGRLTLNPLRHVDPVGLVLLVLCRFGWAKPVPVDMRRFRRPKAGMALTAAAGPAANVLLAFLAIVLFYPAALLSLRGGALWYYLALFFQDLALISAGLAVFNLFPVPPLDGSKLLFACLPEKAYHWLLRYERYGMLVLMALLLFGVLDTPLAFLRSGLLSGLEFCARPALRLAQKILL